MFNHLFLCFRAQVFISLAHVMRFISHNRLNSYLINNVKRFFMDRQQQRRCTRGDSSRTQTRNRKSPVTKKPVVCFITAELGNISAHRGVSPQFQPILVADGLLTGMEENKIMLMRKITKNSEVNQKFDIKLSH